MRVFNAGGCVPFVVWRYERVGRELQKNVVLIGLLDSRADTSDLTRALSHAGIDDLYLDESGDGIELPGAMKELVKR